MELRLIIPFVSTIHRACPHNTVQRDSKYRTPLAAL